ncbi:MAG: carbamoyl-phosphate synthase large subunit, partial [Dehalococcoidia bacterium]|nr:carbamoyl-phosphate synthase large subunit [Dehalococcoidia bacterium]
AYTLGGTGGGIAHTVSELRHIISQGLAASPINQALLEVSVLGWKEIEYEVMRDAADNCITICNMENIDPMGIHTGDSIVVAPSQTLCDKEYQMLRSASLKIIRALGIEGGCNVQFALAPHPLVAKKWTPSGINSGRAYYVIEVNPRVSRSSALASKATGYPIARTAAKIAIGKHLDEIPNRITGKTMSAFEPALDYCVVKIPRWPFDKFAAGDRVINTQMKATGEVMAIDRNFEAALQKAVRSLEMSDRSLLWEDPRWKDNVSSYPLYPNDLRLWAIMATLRRGTNPEELSQQTGIDPWFMHKFQSIVDMEKQLLAEPLTEKLLLEAKRKGFTDEQLGTLCDKLPAQIRTLRKKWHITPVFKMVDTCAAEFTAATSYFYSVYEQENEAIPINELKAVVVGSGPIRIGQGIEFDYCSVHAAWALQELRIKSIMVNSNPETVSTDFDTSDRLYFEPLDEESIQDILDNESPKEATFGDKKAASKKDITTSTPPAILQFGGQTAINLAEPLSNNDMPIMGSDASVIDMAEDRKRFEDFLSRLGIPQPPGGTATSIDEALTVAQLIGYPVLVRPSYVLGGRAMEIVANATELVRYMKRAMGLGSKHPVLIDKYLKGKEVEVDAVCDGETVLIPGIMEHIERAGVHSGDSIAVYPSMNLTTSEIESIIDYSIQIGLGLKIKGLMNIQYVVMPSTNGSGNKSNVYVLEVNPRASRTIPFISKVTGVPMVDAAVKVMANLSLKEQGYQTGLRKKQSLIAIKAPVFSMSKLLKVDTYLGPEMKSTGEVMGVDYNFEAALTKALMAAGLILPPAGGILLSISDRNKPESIPIIKKLASTNYKLYATEGTAAMIQSLDLPVTMITKKLSEGAPNTVDIIKEGKVNGVVNTVTGGRTSLQDGFEIRRAAVEANIPCFTSLDTARVAVEAMAKDSHIFTVQPLREYMAK